MVADNSLLTPWHIFGSSPSTALLQAVSELAHGGAEAASPSSCLVLRSVKWYVRVARALSVTAGNGFS